MTLTLINPNNDDLVLRDIENTQKLCAMLMKTPHYAKLGPDGIYAVVTKAKSLNMDPVYALNGGLYYLKGKVGMSAESMAARMRQAGHSIIKDPKSTPTCCILHGKRCDNGDTWTVSFSIDDAKRADIYNEAGTWRKYGEDMCYNRCVSKLFRQLSPDLSLGTGYTPDEIQEIVSSDNSKKTVPLNIYEVEEEKPKVTKEQVFEFEDILSECSADDQKRAKEYLTSQGFFSYDELPVKAFEILKERAISKREEYQASKKKDSLASSSRMMEMQASLFPEEVK